MNNQKFCTSIQEIAEILGINLYRANKIKKAIQDESELSNIELWGKPRKYSLELFINKME